MVQLGVKGSHHLPDFAAIEAAPDQEGDEPPLPDHGRQSRELLCALLCQRTNRLGWIDALSGKRSPHGLLGNPPLDSLRLEVANQASGTPAAPGFGGGVINRKLGVIQQTDRAQAIEGGIYRGRRVLLLEQPSPQIDAGVRATSDGAYSRAMRRLDVGQRLEP